MRKATAHELLFARRRGPSNRKHSPDENSITAALKRRYLRIERVSTPIGLTK